MQTGAENTKLRLIAVRAVSGHVTGNQSFLPPPPLNLTSMLYLPTSSL